MEKEFKAKYESYKLTVKQWEHKFTKENHRIPSKYDIKDAPFNVRQAYKMYYRMKTNFLSQTLTEALEDDEEDFCDSLNFSNVNDSSFNVSSAISELLDPNKTLPEMRENFDVFEAAAEMAPNEGCWNESLNKPQLKKKITEQASPAITRKVSLKMEPLAIKPLRNPRKSLSKLITNNNLNSFVEVSTKDAIPDLETILLEKSRSGSGTIAERKKPATSSDIKTSLDIGWLERNASGLDAQYLPATSSNLSAASSFGLSNLRVNSSKSLLTSQSSVAISEEKYHVAEASDLDEVSNSEDEAEVARPLLHVAKKRRLSLDAEAPQMLEIAQKHIGHLETIDENEKPNIIEASDENLEGKESEDSPPVLKRKRSMIKRSKDGISKITKTATRLLTRNKKQIIPEADEEQQPEEPDLNFLIDSNLNEMTNVPRASEKELKTTEKLFDDYLKHDVASTTMQPHKLVDALTKAKKDVLQKKIASGTLNENYVRVNLKKKIFVRGKKAFSFSKYKKTAWKSKKAAALSGPEMDMRGCDGGVLKCFSCGGVGHFAQQCKVKGDNLLPIDAEVEEESPFPTLDEAAQMASEQKLLVHSKKPDLLPVSSNDIWKQLKDHSDEEVEAVEADKENEDGNTELDGSLPEPQKSYIRHAIPEDFLKKSGLLDLTLGDSDKVDPVYKLNSNGSLPDTPKEVFDSLALFGHHEFRNGQEQAIMRVMSGVSTLVTLSTGSGKSLCYQLPAYLYRKKTHCITLVISPLVSLMEDQIHGIPDFINAQCLHTNQTPTQRQKTMEAIKAGKVDILLVSPEAVVSGEKSTGFGSLLRQLPPIAFACIDEAHCVSQWSHNFRPSYLMICRVLREKLGVKTVLGLTATATLQTRESIVRHLGIPDGLEGIISDIPLPDNLILTVSQDENRDRALIALIRGPRFELLQSVIIYCTRRDECERIAGFLRTCLQDNKKSDESSNKKRKRANWNAEAYHAGLPASRRRSIQNAFMSGDLRIVVATIAFGMGINKSDIRGIIHYNMPKSFESYVQEVGRAGRDGKQAHCHVFLDSKGSDLSELRRHIYSNSIDRHVIRKLLKKVFVPCSCFQHLKNNPEVQKELDNLIFDTSDDDITMEEAKPLKRRTCQGHEVCFSIEETVQSLDIPEENISTLLCYLELHEQRYIKLLGNAYTKCKLISYGGSKHLKQIAKTSPPLAMAIAMDLKKKSNENPEIASIEFNVVEVAAAIGWDSGVVKYQLKQLEWTTVNGARKRSSITVSFSNLGFRIRSPGDLTAKELDMALDSLEKRTSSQEKAQLVQLQIIFNSLKSVTFKTFAACSEDFLIGSSDKLKTIIRDYFQSDLPMNVPIAEESSDTSDGEIISDIRQMIGMYPDNSFNGRALARLFYGISSPCYPAVIWGRCKYWRAHINVSFSRLVSLGNAVLVEMRRID